MTLPPARSVTIHDRAGWDAHLASEDFVRQERFELELARRHQGARSFTVRGTCFWDGREVDFLADFNHAWQEKEGLRIPNWRERLVCPDCGLNNRMRLLAHRVDFSLGTRPWASAPAAYLTEATTRLFELLSSRSPAYRIVGSEYLGPGRRPGEIVAGIRHEDIEELSFPDASFDAVVTADVLEHVPCPERAFAELLRILRPGGLLWMTVPFDPGRDRNRTRARRVGDSLEHLLEPAYHVNPLDPAGSLVFTDFGWELLDLLRRTGFSDPRLTISWDATAGHLGSNLVVFEAEAGPAPWVIPARPLPARP